MFDPFEREINYLRISVTDKCNLRYVYCMSERGVLPLSHGEFLRFETIAEIVRIGVGLGLIKVRLTGGESLVKRGIVKLVQLLWYLAMTTNGTLLARCTWHMRNAGLDKLNISLDTLNPARYPEPIRVGDVNDALSGIEAVRVAGFTIKINMVVLRDTSPEEIQAMMEFCASRGLTLQLINHFDLNWEKQDDYRLERPPRCERCSRNHLLADENLKTCLHSEEDSPLD